MIPVSVCRGYFSLSGSNVKSLFRHALRSASSFGAFAFLFVVSCFGLILLIPAQAQALQNRAVGPVVIEEGQTVNNDISTGYGRIEVRGAVNGDIKSGSGKIVILGPVEGDVMSGVGNVRVEGPVEGDIKAGLGDARINSLVTGDVEVERGDIFLGPDAKVEGNVYPGNGSYDRAREAVVVGETRFGPSSDLGRVASDTTGDEDDGSSIFGFVGWAFATALFAGATVLVSVLMPRSVGASARMVGASPGWSALAGLGSVVTAVVGFSALLVSGIGIPLLVLLVPAYFALVLFGVVVFAYFLGRKLVLLTGGYRHGNVLAAVVGAVLVALVSLLPLGGVVIGLLALLGTGAALVALVNGRPRRTSGYGPSFRGGFKRDG